jgi:5-methylcytosine-specific restriction endonuclease McrA
MKPTLQDWEKRMSRNEARAIVTREQLGRRARGKCELCEQWMGPILQVHHIVPVKNGGHGWEDNLLCLCPNCHALVEMRMGTGWPEDPRIDDWIRDKFGETFYLKLCALWAKRHPDEYRHIFLEYPTGA